MHHALTSETAVAERRPLSTGAAARRAGCDRATVRRAIERGELVGFRLGPHGHYRVSRQSLQEWLRPPNESEETP